MESGYFRGCPGMHSRRGAENGERFAAVDLPAGTGIEAHAAVSEQDRLEYIADMV
jgi:hypothetical protein